MEGTQWVIQVIAMDDPGTQVEWDTYNVGVIEEGQFKTIYTCFQEHDAEFLLGALKWYTTFKEGMVVTIPPGKAVPVKAVKKKTPVRRRT